MMRNRIISMVLAGLSFVVTGSVCAQLVSTSPLISPSTLLNEEEVKAKYQNCPNGYYSGPRPGKARYTKDKFLWVVTPEFAARFCMPPEFVSSELKGAEAVAFRVVENLDEERCGWGGRGEVCSAGKDLRFEIYYKTGQLPKLAEVRSYRPARHPSQYLISATKETRDEGVMRQKEKALPGGSAAFSNQFGLVGVDATKVVWPIVSLHIEEYTEQTWTGIDYLAVQGSTGFFTNPRMEKLGIKKFVVGVRKPKDGKSSMDRPLAEFAHIIEFPEWFIEKIRQADKARGADVEALGRAAFGMPPALPSIPTDPQSR